MLKIYRYCSNGPFPIIVHSLLGFLFMFENANITVFNVFGNSRHDAARSYNFTGLFSLCQISPSSVSANSVVSSSSHMQTLVFGCFLLVVGVRGESTAPADCVCTLFSCLLDKKIRVSDEGTTMARPRRINRL